MAKSTNPFRYFAPSPEVIGLVVMMSVRCPLSLRNVEDLRSECGVDACHNKVGFWWNRFEPMTKPVDEFETVPKMVTAPFARKAAARSRT
jgi:transposase-like protein